MIASELPRWPLPQNQDDSAALCDQKGKRELVLLMPPSAQRAAPPAAPPTAPRLAPQLAPRSAPRLAPHSALRSLWRATRRACALGLVLSAAAWPALAPAAPAGLGSSELPTLGDSDADGLDLLAERRLGERIMREIRRDPDYLDDPILGEYLARLWQPLLQASRALGNIAPDLDRIGAWELFQVRDRTVNAFALPGAYVGMHLGLLALTASGDELASVLAHELTHVTQRHIARSMVSSRRQNLASAAAMILGVLLAARTNSVDAAQALIVGGQAASIQGQLNFSREMEREADRIGWQVLTAAGFAPGGMAAMFEKLDSSNRLNDSNQYPYLRSHPLTIERIAEARLRASSIGADQAMRLDEHTTERPSVAEHALMQARARALMDVSEPNLRRLQQQGAPGSPEAGPARLGALYAAAMASQRLREPQAADRALADGLALVASRFDNAPQLRRNFELLRLEMLNARGFSPALAQALAGPLAAQTSRPLLLLRAQAALLAQQSGVPKASEALSQSVQALQTWVVDHRQDALAWQALAQVAQAHGQMLRSWRAAAEADAVQGDVQAAVERLRTAQQNARNDPNADYVELSIIQSRLRELEAERRRQMAEARGEPG
jgi:predicted Zn-dependent protease